MQPVALPPTGARTQVTASLHHRLLLLFLAVMLAPAAMAAPFNDNLADAEDLGGDDVLVSGDLRGATAQAGEPAHNGYPARRSVWWTWTAPLTGKAVLTLSSQDHQPELRAAIYRGTLFAGRIVELAEEDRGATYRNWTFRVAAGTKYSIAVDVAEPNGVLNPGELFLFHLVATPDPLTFVKPTNLTNWMAPAVIEIEIASTHPKPLTSIELWNGTTLAAVIKAPPWTYRFTNAHGAYYNLYAQGIDNTGRKIRSITNQIEVHEPNDAFKDATVIPDTTTYGLWTSAGPTSTKETGEPRHMLNSEGSLWWRWKPAYSGLVTLGFTNTAPGNALVLYKGSAVNNLTIVPSSQVTTLLRSYGVEAGTTYYLAWAADRTFFNGLPNAGNTPRTFMLDETTLQAQVAPGAVAIAGRGPVPIVVSDPAGLDRYTSLTFQDLTENSEPIPVTKQGAIWQPKVVGYHQLAVVGQIPGRRSQTRVFSAKVALGNDAFADALPLNRTAPLEYSYRYPIGAGSAEPGEPAHGQSPAVASHWFLWTAPESGRAIFETASRASGTPTAAVYEGPTLTSLVRLGETSWTGFGIIIPYFEIPVEKGHTYRIAVDDGVGETNADAEIVITLLFFPAPTGKFTVDIVRIGATGIGFDVRSPVDGPFVIEANASDGGWTELGRFNILNGIYSSSSPLLTTDWAKSAIFRVGLLNP